MNYRTLDQIIKEDWSSKCQKLMREVGFVEGRVDLYTRLSLAIKNEDTFRNTFADECLHFHFAYVEFKTDTTDKQVLEDAVNRVVSKCDRLIESGVIMQNTDDSLSVVFMYRDSFVHYTKPNGDKVLTSLTKTDIFPPLKN